MGCNQSAEQREQKIKNEQIEQQLKQDKIQSQKEVKMLLLGAGESGKSTILKQMQLIHGVGYSDEERLAYKEIIYSNIIQSMKVILEAMETLGISLGDTANQGHRECIDDLPPQMEGDSLSPEIANGVKALWNDSGVQACFLRSREYQLNDSAKYYFDAMDRLSAADFKPTDQDILRSRVKTTGIVETTFRIQELTYR
jgi:guanine nucleotide-binding protein subunit alpha